VCRQPNFGSIKRPTAVEADVDPGEKAIAFSRPPDCERKPERLRAALDYFDGLVGGSDEWTLLCKARSDFVLELRSVESARDFYENTGTPLVSRRGEMWRYGSALVRANQLYYDHPEKLQSLLTEIEVGHIEREALYKVKKGLRVELDVRTALRRRRFRDLVTAHVLLLPRWRGKVERGAYDFVAALLDYSDLGFPLSRRRVKKIVYETTRAIGSGGHNFRFALSAKMRETLHTSGSRRRA
jgi:hypothetical protein